MIERDGFTYRSCGGATVKFRQSYQGNSYHRYEVYLVEGKWPDKDTIIRAVGGTDRFGGHITNHEPEGLNGEDLPVVHKTVTTYID